MNDQDERDEMFVSIFLQHMTLYTANWYRECSIDPAPSQGPGLSSLSDAK